MEQKKTSAPFVHLHVHSEYSLLDGALRTGKMVGLAKAWGHPAIALTDHGNLFGAVEFYSKAKSEGIKAIIGSEIYHRGHGATLTWGSEHGHRFPDTGAFHLVLLARNNQGYKNLVKIVSRGYTEGLGEVPVCTPEMLEDHRGDMIALSGCLKGEFGYLVQQLRSESPGKELDFEGRTPATKELTAALTAHIDAIHRYVGAGNYYVELIDNQLPEQKRLLPDLVSAARHFALPLVATADAHYPDAEFSSAHAVMLAIKSGLTLKDLRSRNKQARFHLLNNEEFLQVYKAWPEAIANTLVIANQCQVSFEFGKYFLPKFPLPPGLSAADYLEKIAKEKLEERLVQLAKQYGPSFSPERQQEYRARLDYEIRTIVSMGFPGYFLIVQDFINWAKSRGIPVGPGRGSGAGSLVAYALRITDLDPLRFNLLFERFLNPERISMPDFDVDFCQDRRDEVIAYVTEKYGRNNVAQITTFGKMMAKQAVRDVGRVMELSYSRMDKISKLIPARIPDVKVVTIHEAMQAEPHLKEEAQKDETIARVLQITEQLEGLNRQTGVHAAGIVMSDGPMTDYLPVYTTPVDGLITQFEMKNAEKVGLVKFDFLGLKTLTVIDYAVKLIKATVNAALEIETIPLDEPKVYKEISAAHSVGIFQLEGQGMQNLLLKLQPSTFEDIIAVVALFRPGPLGSGMVDDFIERKHGRQAIHYMVPALEPILKETYGIILYQEQVQKIAASLASYTPGEADLLRRAMGKKIKSEMDAQRARFVDGAVKNGINEKTAEELFDLMAKFAEYGFNKSHSAAYGLVSYQTAYLKARYPEQFMAAIMTCDTDKTEKLVGYVEDCRRMKFKILSPDINRSELQFDVPQKGVVGFGLAAIKGLGSASVEPIISERKKNGPYKHLLDLAKRVNLHRVGKKTMELLVKVGALDWLGITRADLLPTIDDLVRFSETHHGAKSSGQRTLFDMLEDDDGSAQDTGAGEHHDAPNPLWVKRLNTLVPPSLEALEEEKRLLGIYLTGHPLAFYREDLRRFSRTTIQHIPQQMGKGPFPLVGLLTDVQERRSKTGKRLAYLTLEDLTGQVEAMMFERDLVQSTFPPKNTPVIATCKLNKMPDGTLGRLTVERVITLEESRQHAVHKCSVSFAAGSAEAEGALRDLKELMERHRGPTPVHLKLKLADVVVHVDAPKLQVELSDRFLRGLGAISLRDLALSYDG